MPRIYFENCSLVTSCEEVLPLEGPLGAVAGVCNLTTQLCQCPTGNSGVGLVGVWNDCHVSAQVRYGMEISLLVLALIAFVVLVACLIHLLVKWRVFSLVKVEDLETNRDSFDSPANKQNNNAPRISSPDVTIRSSDVGNQGGALDSNSNVGGGGAAAAAANKRRPSRLVVNIGALKDPEINVPSRARNQQLLERRRRRWIVFLFINWAIFLILTISIYIGRLSTNEVLEDLNFYWLVCLAGSIMSIFAALWVAMYVWYISLPPLVLFSKLFPQIRKNPLIRFPNSVIYIVAINLFFVDVSSIILIVILPAVDARNLRYVLIPGGLTAFAFYIAFFAITCICLGFLLLQIFGLVGNKGSPTSPTGNKTPKTSTAAAPASETNKTLERSKQRIRVTLIVLFVIAPAAIALLVISAWSSLAQRFFFILYPMLMIAATLVCLFVIILITFGFRSPVNEEENNQYYAAARASGTGGRKLSLSKKSSKDLMKE